MSRARSLSNLGNQNTFAVDTADTQVGIASTVPNATLDVGGDGVFTGIITASSFSGDGSSLTNVSGIVTANIVSVAITTKDINVSAAATITGALSGSTGTFSGAVNVDATTDSTSTSTGALIVDGGLGVAKNVYIGAGLSVAGTLTYEDVTSVDSVGLITAKSGVNVSGGQVTIGTGITMGIAGVATFSGTSDVHLLDSVQLNVGDGSDLVIKHDGSNSRITNGTGALYLEGGGGNIQIRPVTAEQSITAYANGAVALFHDNSQKLETTNNGSYTTGIHTATASLVAGVNNDTGVDLRFRANRSGENETIGNISGYWNDTVVGQIRVMAGEDATNKDDGHLVFFTAPSGSIAERLRIASNGRIGIATEVPEALVDIEGGEVYYHSGTGNAFGVKLSYSNGNSTGIIDSYGNHDLEFRTNNVARFVLDTSGNLQSKTTTQNGYVGLTTTSNAINLTFGGTSGTSPRMYLKGVGNGQSDAGDIFIAAGTGGLMQLRSAEDIRFEVNSDSTTAEALRIDSTGRLLVGLTTARTAVGAIGDPHIQLEGTGADTGSMSIIRHAASSAGSYLVLGKTRGTTDLSNTIVQDDDTIGSIIFAPADGNDINQVCASITAMINGTPGSNDVPGALTFRTTSDGGTSPTERLKITRTGGFSFNNGEFVERVKITAGKLSDNTNIDLANGMVHYFTTQESTTSTPNIRVNSSTSLNDVMTDGDVCTVTLVTTAAAGGYSANMTIDGNAITEEWVGGSAPSSGGSNGLDIYVYTIICIHASNTGDSGFKVIANLTNAT